MSEYVAPGRPDPESGRRGAGFGHTFAALDLGTNNCRLLIARRAGESFHVIDAFSRIVRLGEGLTATGRLSEAAMERTIAALRICAGKMRRRGVTHARSVATEACRQAQNCEDFVGRVRAETGLEIEIIPAHEEAMLAFRGCAPLLEAGSPHALVFDIGGGSTELGWLDLANGAPELLGWLSIPVGVVTLAERYGAAPLPPPRYEAMVGEVAALLQPFETANRIAQRVAEGAVQMLGTSGTVTTLAGVRLELPRYERRLVDGTYLGFEEIFAVNRQLAAMDCVQRAANPCIGRERADLVVAGCVILEAICRLWPVGRLRVADRGVREGILVGLMLAAARERPLRRWNGRRRP